MKNKINNGLIISPKVVIPIAVLKAINNIPEELLLPIDENVEVAKEECILLLSVLDASSPVYDWRRIHNTLFSSQCGTGYPKTIEALRYALTNGKILQDTNFYMYEAYEFTQPEVIKKRCINNIKTEMKRRRLMMKKFKNSANNFLN